MRWYWWALMGGGLLGILGLSNGKRVTSDLKKIKLSKDFVLADFVKTSTGIDNIPGKKEVDSLRALVTHCLQPLRDYLGLPIVINSGYRSPLVNKAVPGSSDTSQHMKGEAADFKVLFTFNKSKISQPEALNMARAHLTRLKMNDGLEAMHTANSWVWKIPNQTIIDLIFALKLPYDQVIDEDLNNKRWVHWSYSSVGGNQRYQWLTARDNRAKKYQLIKTGQA